MKRINNYIFEKLHINKDVKKLPTDEMLDEMWKSLYKFFWLDGVLSKYIDDIKTKFCNWLSYHTITSINDLQFYIYCDDKHHLIQQEKYHQYQFPDISIEYVLNTDEVNSVLKESDKIMCDEYIEEDEYYICNNEFIGLYWGKFDDGKLTAKNYKIAKIKQK